METYAPHRKVLTVLIDGAGREGLWVLHTHNDPKYISTKYTRGKLSPKKYKSLKKKGVTSPLIHTYAKRIWKQIKKLDDTVYLWGWSMGFLVAIEVEKIARKHRPGFVRCVVGICPAVYGGPLEKPLHKEMKWLITMLSGSVFFSGKRTAAALKEIKKVFPGYSHKRWEDRRALLESISGSVMLPPPSKRPPIFIFYSPEDRVIPEAVSLFVAERAGLSVIAVPGYDHDIPIIDTAGVVLDLIHAHIADHFAQPAQNENPTSS